VTSSTAEFTCDHSNGTCVLALAGMPIDSIPMTCVAAECLTSVGMDKQFNGTDVARVSNLNINPIIAAIPAMLLLLLMTFMGAGAALGSASLWWSPTTDAQRAEVRRKMAPLVTRQIGALE
jgi:hypothetical protein